MPRPITAESCNLPPEAKPINATFLLASDDPSAGNKTMGAPEKSVQGSVGASTSKMGSATEEKGCRCGCCDCGCEWCRGRGGCFGSNKQKAASLPEPTHPPGDTNTETTTTAPAKKSMTLSPLKKEALQAIVDTIKGHRNDEVVEAQRDGTVTQQRQRRVYSKYSTMRMRRPMPPRVAPIMRFIDPPRAKNGRNDG